MKPNLQGRKLGLAAISKSMTLKTSFQRYRQEVKLPDKLWKGSLKERFIGIGSVVRKLGYSKHREKMQI